MYREPLGRAKAAGIVISLIGIGVLVIVFRGDFDALHTISLVQGDIWIATAAITWAVYSVVL